jgi:hypothetical protein
MASGQHRACRHRDGRDIQTAHRHQHPRRDLVAVGQQHDAVQLMRLHDGLDQIGNQFARRQRIVHAAVAHGDAVANPRHAEQKRDAAPGADAPLDLAFEAPHSDMPGNQVGKTRTDPDKGFGHLRFRHAGGIQQRAIRHPLDALFDLVAPH